MVPKSGYWRYSESSDIFFPCPFYNACLNGEPENGQLALTGRCESGYEGNKCQSCRDGYTRVGKNECYACPDEAENIAILLLLAFVMIIGVVLLVKSTLKSANKPKSLHSVYLRIFVNYL